MQEGTRIETIQICTWTHSTHSFSYINNIHSVPIILTNISLKPVSSASSKSDVGETQGVRHHETNLL